MAGIRVLVGTRRGAFLFTYSEPQDHGFMFRHGFQDLDGHVWEVFQMDAD